MPLATSSTRPFPDLGTFTEHLDGKSKALVGGRVACKVSVAHFSSALTRLRFALSGR